MAKTYKVDFENTMEKYLKEKRAKSVKVAKYARDTGKLWNEDRAKQDKPKDETQRSCDEDERCQDCDDPECKVKRCEDCDNPDCKRKAS